MVSNPLIHAFIQARMSSTRFPGKALAPLYGRPIIAHVISQVGQVIPSDQITVATSTDQSDDPLASYVRDIGISVYRGPLDEVFTRFQLCLKEYPCTWFFRVCGDSPILERALFQAALSYSDRQDVDLVTNVFPRTFPIGKSVEMLKSEVFAAIDPNLLTPEEKEHLTMVYYNQPSKFGIINIQSTDPELAEMNFSINTFEDLRRLENNLRSGANMSIEEKIGVDVAGPEVDGERASPNCIGCTSFKKISRSTKR